MEGGMRLTMPMEDVAVPGFLEGLVKSLSMIIVSEIGDKTFFVAALLAMRHPRSSVMVGSLGALVLMTVLSSFLGWAAPSLISPKLTHHVATVLFFAFGIKSLIDVISSGEEGSSELEEVEAELNEDLKRAASSQSIIECVQKEEDGRTVERLGGKVCAQRLLLCTLFSPVAMQAFSLAFFSEWGDKSQIATIGMASQENVLGVTLGGCLGHFLCTTAAVLGGRHLVTRISEQKVALCSGILFLFFAIHNVVSFGNSNDEMGPLASLLGVRISGL